MREIEKVAKDAAFPIIGYDSCNCPKETRNDPAMICKFCLLTEVLLSERESARREAVEEAVAICNEEWSRAGASEDAERKGFGASAQAWLGVTATRIQALLQPATGTSKEVDRG